MNKNSRQYKKLIYITIKNSWKRELKFSNVIQITSPSHNLKINAKYPATEIHMDFRKRKEIFEFGVKKVSF